ncbi:MAG: roadblock/LC7 domain-containing protein [Candidatus Heimdallarchaeum aukensis]|uniref:Roadblock/LC7 domain-containing protein n=1 Tax=Candidatus Heimdallarchaeum aukensis TaxID=2876573 RepID=A0A9Y1BN67_9ARCH|nr:MAG: roadblock/LC7 domain-containing protein [Candidatus Heimdallarchaeum aukensis]
MITDLTPEQKKAVIQILKQITKKCDLGAIAVVTSEGQELAFFAEQGTDSVIMAALASALNAAGMQTVTQLKYGELDQVIIKGREGFVILQNTGEVITLAASREIYSLALSMQVLARYASDIRNAIS